MSQKSKIEWTDTTWNPVTGCSKVSAGCRGCYAERFMNRFEPGRKFTDVRSHSERLDAPLHWKKPRMVFVNSMSDLFHKDVPTSFILDVFDVISRSPQHVFQILTKRYERAADFFNAIGKIPENIWMGFSVEDQETADLRLPYLNTFHAAVKFISAEPLIGEVDLTKSFGDTLKYHAGGLKNCISWVIAGGESGSGSRPMHPEWARFLRDQCKDEGVPFFFKQWGEYLPYEEMNQAPFWKDQKGNEHDGHTLNMMNPETSEPGKGWYPDPLYGFNDRDESSPVVSFKKVGKKAAGRLLDGQEYNELPKLIKL
jgi:protein gp37